VTREISFIAALDYEERPAAEVLESLLEAGYDSVEWTMAHAEELLAPASALACQMDLVTGGEKAAEETIRGIEAAAAAGGGLAMIGAIAVACFVRLLGAVFQGEPRDPGRVAKAHDPGLAMKLPMVMLAAACLVIGFFPGLAAPALEAATAAWLPAGATVPHIADLAPQAWIGWLGLALVAAVALLALGMRLHPRAEKAPRRGTWDCGYAAPTSRMEYTATSFGQSVVRLFSFVLWPSRREPRVEGPFPAGSRFSARVPDPVLDRALRPLFKSSRRWSSMVRFMQQGQTQLYILYILIIAIVLLAVGGTGVPR